ncbi:MAG: ASKHA domain-containing protein [Planctomycetota bacterium]|nr:ASKHA domain-containing protein [Planctomycetota bacterium]
MATKAQGIIELPDRRIECQSDAPCLLTDMAAGAGVILNVACGGVGTCGGCAVDILAGRFSNLDGGEIAIDTDKARRVLACRTRLMSGDFLIRVPRHSLVSAGEKVVMDFTHTPPGSLRPLARKEYLRLSKPSLQDAQGDLERIIDELRHRGYEGPINSSVQLARAAEQASAAGYELTVTIVGEGGTWHLIRIEPGDMTSSLYAAAVDVGTTTVVVALVDLVAGEIIDAASGYNQQIIRCDDVAGRITYAGDPDRLEELRKLVVESTVNRLLDLLVRRHGLERADVAHMTVSGNTIMAHLFCGISPMSLGAVPFAPVTNFPGPYRAETLRLAMNGDGLVDIFPSSAGYIGGDVTADMYVCGLTESRELTVIIDIGTNAEIVVGNRDRSIACAAPAGPAFEGSGLTCGMRAAIGAIDTFALEAIDSEPTYTVIGRTKPAGVCGSGLVDLLAQARRTGLISQTGRFTDEAKAKCPRIVQADDGIPAYEIVLAEKTDDGLKPILITERDIATLLQAKGVIFAALEIAMKHFGAGFEKIEHFYLAGGFARHIDLDNCVATGLLPDIDREKYTFIGNGSLAGAFVALLDEEVRTKLPHVAAAPTVIELNLDKDFQNAYAMAMLLP